MGLIVLVHITPDIYCHTVIIGNGIDKPSPNPRWGCFYVTLHQCP